MIRLWIDGYVLTYKAADGEEFYIVHCDDCERYYLDRVHKADGEFRCPFCYEVKVK